VLVGAAVLMDTLIVAEIPIHLPNFNKSIH